MYQIHINFILHKKSEWLKIRVHQVGNRETTPKPRVRYTFYKDTVKNHVKWLLLPGIAGIFRFSYHLYYLA